MDLSIVPYQPHNHDHDHDHHHHHQTKIKYKECMRNHAASLGRHANDGCGEFMPTPSLTCAACGCHRNFHRQELPGNPITHHHHHLVQPPPLLLYNPSHHTLGYDDHDLRSETPEKEDMNLNVGPGRGPVKSKRCRTKFTQEQKERMLEFAERIGWRIQRHQEVALNNFCNELGIKRNVMKVWMHNNKNAYRRRESPVVTPPPSQEPVVGV